MKALILAAGYENKRLPFIRHIPQPLLPIAGKPLLELILDKVLEIKDLNEILILNNEINKDYFDEWQKKTLDSYKTDKNKKIKLISNGIRSAVESRSAIGDIKHIVKEKGINEDLLVIAGDNFFKFDLNDFIKQYNSYGNNSIIAYHKIEDSSMVSKLGFIEKIDDNGEIKKFIEKPDKSETMFASTFCYIFNNQALELLSEYQPNGTSHSGDFIIWLKDKKIPIYGFSFNQDWFDIGNYDHYKALNQKELLKKLEGNPEKPQFIEAVILFADIIGSATISEYKTEEEYDEYICEFQEIALKVINDKLIQYDEEDKKFCEYSTRGDEVVLIMYTKSREKDIKTAISISIELKRSNFLAKYNKRRKGKSFLDIGIGIHYGNVVLKKHPSANCTLRTFNAEGYSINLAKRIESYSREGKYSKIMLSKAVKSIASSPIIYFEHKDVSLTSIYGKISLLEIQIYPVYDENYNESKNVVSTENIDYYINALESSGYDMWLLFTVAKYFYDEEEYNIAQSYYNIAIESSPKLAVAYLFHGRSLYRQNDFDASEESLRKAIEYGENSSISYHFLAVTLRRLHQFDEAIRYHKSAIQNDPQTPYEFNAYAYTLADSYIEGNKNYSLDDAFKNLNIAIQKCFKNNLDLDYLLKHTEGFIYFKQKNYDKAIECFNMALKNLDDNVKIRTNKKREKSSELYSHLALCYLGKKENDMAKSYRHKSCKSLNLSEDSVSKYYWLNDEAFKKIK